MSKKIILSSFVGVSAIGAVTPLAVMSANTSGAYCASHVHQGEDDIQYGIDENTYSSMKEDFKTKLIAKMKDEHIQEGSKVWNEKLSTLNNSLATFDDQANKTNITYSQLTTSLINFARAEYGFSLRRVTKAKWDDILDLYQGTADSFSLYMDHNHFSQEQKQKILSAAQTRFEEIQTKLIAQGYKECDPYGGLKEATMLILGCFDQVNEYISKTAADYQISNFVSKYSISAKRNVSTALYSNIVNKLVVGEVITDFNEIFTMVDAETGQEKSLDMGPSGMIPNYAIRPKFAGFTVDKYSNSYVINIDWTAISNNYLYTNKESAAEGHLYNVTSSYYQNLLVTDMHKYGGDDDATSFSEAYKVINAIPKRLLTYPVQETKAGQNSSINEVYFGEKGIRFQFPNASDAHARLEPFYNQYIDDGFTFQVPEDLQSELGASEIAINNKGIALTKDLAEAGLQISEEINGQRTWLYLSDVLKNIKSKDASNYTLVEKFVANCNIFSVIKINPHTSTNDSEANEISDVENNFYVAYANPDTKAIDWSDKQAAIEYIYRAALGKFDVEYQWENLNSQVQPGTCLNYVTSEQYFYSLSEKYTTISRMVNMYANSSNEVDNTAAKLNAIKIISYIDTAIASANAAAFVGLLILDFVSPPGKIQKTRKASWWEEPIPTREFWRGRHPIEIFTQMFATLSETIEFCKKNVIIMDVVGLLAALGNVALVTTTMVFLKNKIVDPFNKLKNITNEYMAKPGFKDAFDDITGKVKDDGQLLAEIEVDPKKGSIIKDQADYDKKLELYKKSSFAHYKEMNKIYSNWDWKYSPISEEIHQQIKNYTAEFTAAINSYYIATFGKSAVANEDIKITSGNVLTVKILMIASTVTTALAATLLIVSTNMHLKIPADMSYIRADSWDAFARAPNKKGIMMNLAVKHGGVPVKMGFADGTFNLFTTIFSAFYYMIVFGCVASVVGFAGSVANLILLCTCNKLPTQSTVTSSNLPDGLPVDDMDCKELQKELEK